MFTKRQTGDLDKYWVADPSGNCCQAYNMVDTAKRGTIFYRIVISPAPKREDRYRDLNLSEITIQTMLALEERLGKPIQFVAAIHDDHSPHRHVHTLVLVQGVRLTREDFQALRLEATEQALSQRRLRDRIRGRDLSKYRSRTFSRNPFHARQAAFGRLYRGARPLQSYTCPLCGYHQSLPSSNLGYRCPSCGLRMRRERSTGAYRIQRREVGLELTL